MQFNVGAFNTHLSNLGQECRWRKSFACPCVNPHSGAARRNCPQCAGRGLIWAPPVDSVAGMANSRIQREWAEFGQWENGDIVVTIPENTPMYEMRQFDRVLMLNNTDGFSLQLTRGENDRLHMPVATIERVFWLDEEGGIVEGSIPGVEDDGSLTWASGGPPAGVQYSITGTRYAEFFCFGDYPSNRNMHRGMRLPRRVVLRRFDLFGRSTPPSA